MKPLDPRILEQSTAVRRHLVVSAVLGSIPAIPFASAAWPTAATGDTGWGWRGVMLFDAVGSR